MPPEWAPHRRCWMAWPCNEELWGARLDEARDAYAEVALAIAQFEPVTMVALPDDVAEVSIRCRNKVNAVPFDINDSWVRDFGPTFLLDGDGTLGGVDGHSRLDVQYQCGTGAASGRRIATTIQQSTKD